MNNCNFNGRLSILVSTCDAYADLWEPFFLMLKKYLPLEIPIYLNTESKSIQMEGLDIRCIHPPERFRDCPYGKRMILALRQIQTDYVLMMLDDFFLRKTVDTDIFSRIIKWMDEDKDIVCFNSEATAVYADWELNKYPGFRRFPPGNNYTLNMQAAIWRTKSLIKYWRPDISPWEWELLVNTMTTKYPKDKFYCASTWGDSYMDYGHYATGDLWGVVRGKWFFPDVKPFFEKEGITADLSRRGEFVRENAPSVLAPTTRKARYERIKRCLGTGDMLRYFVRCRMIKLSNALNRPAETDYFEFLKQQARNRFLKKRINEEEN